MKRLMCLVLALAATPALAVSTSFWTQTSEADFKAGTLDNVVATNLGEVKLSRALKTLLDEDPRISTVNNLVEAPDGTIYAGTGPNAVLLRIKDQKVTTASQIPDATDVLSVAIDKSGAVLVGTGGEHGKVLRIDKPGDKPREIFSAEGVQYIWALAATSDGNVYAATGPTGKLFQLKPDGTSKVLLETDENNLLSLISDGKDNLFVGTDPHGLVYRVNRNTGESFVVYNAPEAEITALAMDQKGNLYAATGEGAKSSRPRPIPPSRRKAAAPREGRPAFRFLPGPPQPPRSRRRPTRIPAGRIRSPSSTHRAAPARWSPIAFSASAISQLPMHPMLRLPIFPASRPSRSRTPRLRKTRPRPSSRQLTPPGPANPAPKEMPSIRSIRTDSSPKYSGSRC